MKSLSFMQTTTLFQHYEACLKEGELALAKGFLFKAYQKRPRNKDILSHLQALNQNQVDLPHSIFKKMDKQKIFYSHINSIESLLFLLLGVCILLIALFLPPIFFPFSLFLFIISLSTFSFKAYTTFFSKYAVITAPHTFAYSTEDKIALDIYFQGSLLKVGKVEKNKVKILDTKYKNIWIAKQDLWIIK